MNILYVHGFGSSFSPNNEKVKALAAHLGPVYGVDIDYCEGYETAYDKIRNAVIEHDIDLLVGTSLGGNMAANVGARLGIPFVAINPSYNPSETMMKRVGRFVDFAGRECNLTREIASSFRKFPTSGCGLVAIDLGDELFDFSNLIQEFEWNYKVVTFDGGSHRFDHINELIPMIKETYEQCSTIFDLYQ